MLTILADGTSLFFSPSIHQKRGETGRRNRLGTLAPAGANVVPANNDGIPEINGWKLYYLGWQPDNFDATTFVRGTTTRDNLKPAKRKGCLDANRLQAHGLMAERMKSDPFFFLQLLLPICYPKRSRIDGDGRMLLFSAATTHTNGYTIMEKG
jgi:hypothetical protein